MERYNTNCQFLSEFDLFGKNPEFYFKGKPQRTTIFGKILTYFYIGIYIAYFIYKIIRMIKKFDITFYESNAFEGVPSLKLTNDLFYLGFSVDNKIDPTLYYPVVYFYEESRVGAVMEPKKEILELELCNIEKFGEKYRDIFRNKVDNLYCIKDIDKITLEGYPHLDSFKYIYIAIMPCIGQAPTGEKCQDPIEVMNYFAGGAKITFMIEDVDISPYKYYNPSQPIEKGMQAPAFLTLYNSIYAYLQIVNLETDKDVIGFEGLSDIETQQFLKYEESWIITAPSPHTQGLNPKYPIADVTIQLSAKVLTYKRKNTKLFVVLGDVGGLMEVVRSFFNIIASLITDILYDKALINNLFSFDLDKKIIKIKGGQKKKQNDNNQLGNNPKNEMSNIITISNTIEDSDKNKLDVEDSLNKKSSFNNKGNFKTMKKKKKIVKRIKTKPMELMKNKNLNEEELKVQNPGLNIFNIESKENLADITSNKKIENKETEEKNSNKGENSRIIDRIKMNFCCIYFWYCFARKKRNIQNILLDEGMEIIIENLDIMNIFKKIYAISTIEEFLKSTENIINMSNRCKTRIYALSQPKLKG